MEEERRRYGGLLPPWRGGARRGISREHPRPCAVWGFRLRACRPAQHLWRSQRRPHPHAPGEPDGRGAFHGNHLRHGLPVRLQGRRHPCRDKGHADKRGRRPLRRDGDGCEREDSLGHSSSTKELTCQAVSARRGKEGMGENGVLQDGVAVHDCWRPYWKYELPGHAVCCAHLLRELTGIEEFSPGHGWASRLKAPLMDMKRTEGRTMARGEDAIPRKAEVRCGIRPDPGGGRGRLTAPPRTGGGEGRGRERNGLSWSA